VYPDRRANDLTRQVIIHHIAKVRRDPSPHRHLAKLKPPST
jgi:hypothetical protein